MLKRARDKGWLGGLGASRNNNAIVNLQYADDTLLFGRCDIVPAATLKCALLCIKKWSLIKPNLHKKLQNLGTVLGPQCYHVA